MHVQSLARENSKLYITLPISFNSRNYIVEMSDAGSACSTYGAYIVSTNKFQVFNIGFDISNKTISVVNEPGLGGYVLSLGF